MPLAMILIMRERIGPYPMLHNTLCRKAKCPEPLLLARIF